MSTLNMDDANVIDMQIASQPGSTELLFYGEVVTFYIVVQAANVETIQLTNNNSIVNYTDFTTGNSTPFNITGSGQNVHIVASGWFNPNSDPYTLNLSTSTGHEVQIIYGSATPQYQGNTLGGSYIVMAEDGTDNDFNDIMVQFNWFKYQG